MGVHHPNWRAHRNVGADSLALAELLVSLESLWDLCCLVTGFSNLCWLIPQIPLCLCCRHGKPSLFDHSILWAQTALGTESSAPFVKERGLKKENVAINQGGGLTVCRKRVHVCGTIPLVF